MPADPVETVLFDLDDTLCEYRRSPGDLIEIACEAVGVEPFFGQAEYEARYGEFTDESDDVRDLRERCFAAIAADRGRDPDLGRDIARAFAAERDHTNVRPLPGAREAVETLAERHRVGVVTNGAPGMQRRKLSALPFADRFETVVHAGYDAPAKPAPDPFHEALAALDGRPERAVHVGNSLSSDVAGAHNAGCRSVWLRQPGGPGDHRPHFTVDGMAELAAPPWE
ncbi:HAD family hydrolase [Haloglomus litoreum]|uniref:HAD family hydrolase n=1 Tax=Haloglomus litoreum TaxID=3034026 RepID=UPI0023E7E58E|nr:HAD family hydrolase [Haloglomus sp. DT116]